MDVLKLIFEQRDCFHNQVSCWVQNFLTRVASKYVWLVFVKEDFEINIILM